MLVDIFGVHPTTSEHPHKLSERIVKDLSAATGEVRLFYSLPPCCQPLIRCFRIGAELPVRTERAAHSTVTSTAVNPALATSQQTRSPSLSNQSSPTSYSILPRRQPPHPMPPPDTAPASLANLSEPRILRSSHSSSSDICATLINLSVRTWRALIHANRSDARPRWSP